MLHEHKIRDFSGIDYTYAEFLEQIKKYNHLGFNAYIGTDSKIVKGKIAIVSVICFHKEGSSGKIFYTKERISRKQYPSLRARMLLEAFRSVEIASELEPLFKNHKEIHLDVGNTARSKTSAYEKELQSLVVGQGYQCVIKDQSWASSSVADKILRKE